MQTNTESSVLIDNNKNKESMINLSDSEAEEMEDVLDFMKHITINDAAKGLAATLLDSGEAAEHEEKSLSDYLKQFQTSDEKDKEDTMQRLKIWVSETAEHLEQEVLEPFFAVDAERPKLFKKKDFSKDVTNAFEKIDTEAFEAMISAFETEEEGSNSYNLVNLKTVIEQLVLFKTILPDVKPYYAIKCCPDQMVVRTLCWLNSGFDCASWNEIDQVHKEFDRLRRLLLHRKTNSDKEFSKNALIISSEREGEEGNGVSVQQPSPEPAPAKPLTEEQRMMQLFSKYLLDINYDAALKCESIHDMFSMLERGTLTHDGLEGATMEQRKIVYAHPCKLKQQIKQAIDATVGYTTLDNLMEIEKIAKIQKETNKKMKALIRIATHDEKSKFSFSTKYGAPLDTIDEIIKKCFQLDVEIIGCSFHTGTGCPSPQPYITALNDCKEIFQKVRNFTNGKYDPRVVDIGGGFWGHSVESFFNIANPLRPIIDELFPVSEGYRVIAEPGRFFATRCFTLVTEIYSIRDIHPNEPNNPENLTGWCYLNDSMYHSLNNINFDSYVFNPIVWRQGEREKGKFRYKIFGCTCDSLDVICKNWETDEAVGEGDIMFFPNFGAYTVSCSTRFNGFDFCPSKYLFV